MTDTPDMPTAEQISDDVHLMAQLGAYITEMLTPLIEAATGQVNQMVRQGWSEEAARSATSIALNGSIELLFIMQANKAKLEGEMQRAGVRQMHHQPSWLDKLIAVGKESKESKS